MANFIVVTSSANRLLFEYNDYAPILALGEPDPKPQNIYRTTALKNDVSNVDLIQDADGNTRIRTSFQGKGGYLQVCNDGSYDLTSSLAAGVTIIESINGVATNTSNGDLFDKILAALA